MAGIPRDAWEQGRADAKAGHIPTLGADDHVLAASAGPPWVEPRWPPHTTTRRVTLHGGAYDGVLLDLYTLGSTLRVGGEHGPAEYEYKESDDSTASYTAVGAEIDANEALFDSPPPIEPGSLF